MTPTHTTKGGVKVATKGRPHKGKIQCYRMTGGFHGWLWVAQLTPITR